MSMFKPYLTAFLLFTSAVVYAEDTTSFALSPPIAAKVQTLLETYLKECPSDQLKIKPLTGGFSGAHLFLITAGNKQYVFRIADDFTPPSKQKKELFAMQKAAELDIAPPIYWISNDDREVLMQFIEGGTITSAAAKETDTIVKIAHAMAKVHLMPKNPYNNDGFLEYVETFYHYLKAISISNPQLENALEIVQNGDKALKELGSPSIAIHGDLNPRNILAGTPKIYFIDWSEGMFTEPFHELAYFSILIGYGDKEERILLENYLQRAPDHKEIERFRIAKKMNLARLVMGAVYLLNERAGTEDKIDPSIAEKEWVYYANGFADNKIPLDSQFFFEMIHAALNYANAL